MASANMELRVYAKKKAVPLWKIAIHMGFSDNTLYRRLREQQAIQFVEAFKKAVDTIAEKED